MNGYSYPGKSPLKKEVVDAGEAGYTGESYTFKPPWEEEETGGVFEDPKTEPVTRKERRVEKKKQRQEKKEKIEAVKAAKYAALEQRQEARRTARSLGLNPYDIDKPTS